MSTAIYKLRIRKFEQRLTGNDIIADMYRKLDRFLVIGWYAGGQPYIAASGETDKQCFETVLDGVTELKIYCEEQGQRIGL